MKIKVTKTELEEALNKAVKRVIDEEVGDDFLIEMATCGVEKWGNRTFKIAVHGASSADRPTPHVHVYLNNDQNPYRQFNFEVSLVDLFCTDQITPIYQLDEERNIKRTHRDECTWTYYKEIKKGLRTFFNSRCTNNKFGNFSDNLERVVYEWNRETDFVKTEQGGNPLKDYFQEHNLVILPKYQKYLKEKDENPINAE